MNLRPLGSTGLQVSERGFGAWAIGGTAYGHVSTESALSALSVAEEFGCNFIDTAAVYGESEALIGRFLKGRRSRWIVATKFSAQPQGMTVLVEQQLTRLGTDCIDFYQIHWAPGVSEEALYRELDLLKSAGKIRFAGVSLKGVNDLQRVLGHDVIDGVQIPVSLLDPVPLVPALDLLRRRQPAVIARSALRGGFLAGKYHAGARFADGNDQRSHWEASRVARLAREADAFRFLERDGSSLREAALEYPLSFPEVSTLLISCKDSAQAAQNFGMPSVPLDPEALQRIRRTQSTLGVSRSGPFTEALRRIKRLLRARR